MISLIRDSQKKNLRISNFIKKGKIRATSKHKNLLVLIKKYHSSGVTKSITVKPFSNKDVNQLCFEILVLHYKVLSGKGCRQQASFPHDSPFQNTFFCKKKKGTSFHSLLPLWFLLTISKKTVFTACTVMSMGSRITKSNYPFVRRSSNNIKEQLCILIILFNNYT